MATGGQIILKLEGVKGESKLAKYPGEIEIESISLGAHNSVDMSRATGPGTGGRVNMDMISLTKKTDKSSGNLLLGVCTGQVFNKASIYLMKSASEDQAYLEVNLENVILSSWTTAGANDTPHEAVSLAYETIEYVYWEQDEKGKYTKGSVKKKYDVKKGKPV